MKHSSVSNIIIVAMCFGFVLFFSGCSSSHKKQTAKTSTETKKSPNTNDTAKTDQEKVKQKLLSATKPSLSPGTASVTARVIMYNDSSPMNVTIMILGTHGYGSSTPALSKGTELRVRISESLLNKYSPGAIKEEFSTSKPLSLILGFSQQVSVNGGPSHFWSIIDFKKN